MEPTIPVGAIVVVRKAESYVVDNVITYQRLGEESATTHRIVKDEIVDGEFRYTVQGDANNAPDVAPVAHNEVRGKVWVSIPYLGFILDFIQQPIGFALIIGVPALAILAEEFGKIRKAMHSAKLKSTDDKENTV